MSSGKALDVATLAATVLAGVVEHYDAAGVELPEYRTIRQGDTRTVAWDEPALLVTFPAIRWGPPSGSGQARPTGPAIGMVVRHAVIGLQLIRLAVDPDGPVTVVTMTAAALIQAQDMGLLSQAIAELCDKAGPLARYGQATPGDVVALGPQGQVVTVETTLAVTVLDTVGP